MNDELKPCPFCGGQAKVLIDPDGTPSGIHCKCGALTRFLFMPRVVGENFGAVQERIVERWNRRASNDPN